MHAYAFAVVRLFALALILCPAAATSAAEQRDHDSDYTQLSNSDLLDFRYSFPSPVGSDPQLLRLIRKDRSSSYSEALSGAGEDAGRARSSDYPFHQHLFWRDWIIEGQSDKMMSLRSQTETFLGGAHGMHVTAGMLWDKDSKAKLRFADLFSSKGGYWTALQAVYCKALAAERLRRVQMKGSCPKPEELIFIPADTSSNWKLDTIQIVADPYTAGSYAEGRYEVPVKVTAKLIRAMKSEFRESFEAQGLQ